MDGNTPLWDLQSVLTISFGNKKCIGKTMFDRSCRNAVSALSIVHAEKTMSQLTTLPQEGGEAKELLLRLAGLLLCRRNHQSQSREVADQWEAQMSQSRITRIARNPALSPPLQSPPARAVTIESLRLDEFYPTDRMVASVEIEENKAIWVSLFRKLPPIPGEACAICHGQLCDDPDYLHCRSCRDGQYHWSCFRSWSLTQERQIAKCTNCQDGAMFAMYHNPSAESPSSNGHNERVSNNPEWDENTVLDVQSQSEPVNTRPRRNRRVPDRYRPSAA